MSGRSRRRPTALLALSFVGACLAAGCNSVAGYSAFPLDLGIALPSDAFSRCRSVLLREFETLSQADAASFRLQTAWQPIADPPGERRATVYRDDSRDDSLAVIVELRRLSVPLIGVPHWTAPRGDGAAERRLAEQLTEALRDPVAPGTEESPADS